MLTTPLSVVTGQDLVHCPTKSVWWEVLFLENMMSWWHMMAPISKQFSDLKIQMRRWRGGSKCTESLGKANQDRNQTLQRAHVLLWPQTLVARIRRNQCQRDCAGKDRSEQTEASKESQPGEEQGQLLSACSLPCPAPGPGGHTTL